MNLLNCQPHTYRDIQIPEFTIENGLLYVMTTPIVGLANQDFFFNNGCIQVNTTSEIVIPRIKYFRPNVSIAYFLKKKLKKRYDPLLLDRLRTYDIDYSKPIRYLRAFGTKIVNIERAYAFSNLVIVFMAGVSSVIISKLETYCAELVDLNRQEKSIILLKDRHDATFGIEVSE